MQHKEKYTLTWHSYSDHLREAMKDLMISSDFADVTLITDDKQQIKAHRNILSACSPFFQNIFQLHSNIANTVIYLRGIQHSEIESIMQLLYLGEARFHKDRISEFFQVSKDLEIKNVSTGIEMNDQTAWKEEGNEHENIVGNEEPAQTFNEDANVEYQAETVITQIIKHNAPNKKRTRTDVANCDQCDKQFTMQGHLNSHIKSVHESVKYACNECDYQFSTQGNLKKHIQSKHEGVKYACKQCDYQATQQGGLKAHIQSKHEGVKYACNQCDQQFTAQGSLKIHIQSKHEGVKYACNQCDYKATQQNSLKAHIQSKHEDIKYACNQCDYQTKWQTQLTRHIQSVHNGVKHACNQCDYQATRRDHLTKHIRSIHEGVKYV